ncbi:MAG: helix-turn-helix transcriptional regulator [Bdellovibrio sp.]|nr:helix-turn-helix transcriptional regulator [Bdellovibrio sp.]
MEIEDFNKKKFLAELGAHIAKVRKSKGYSQDRVCLEAGLSRGALSKIESGKVEPRITTLALIAITIDVGLAKLTNVDMK